MFIVLLPNEIKYMNKSNANEEYCLSEYGLLKDSVSISLSCEKRTILHVCRCPGAA